MDIHNEDFMHSFWYGWYSGDSRIVSDIIAADVLHSQMQPSQSFGDMISEILPEALGTSPFEGFSLHSLEECRTTIRGSGCDKYAQ